MLPFPCWFYGPETWSQGSGVSGGPVAPCSGSFRQPPPGAGLSEFPQLVSGRARRVILEWWRGGLPSLETRQQHTNNLVCALRFGRVHIARRRGPCVWGLVLDADFGNLLVP